MGNLSLLGHAWEVRSVEIDRLIPDTGFDVFGWIELRGVLSDSPTSRLYLDGDEKKAT
jgi:hypothetical protein